MSGTILSIITVVLLSAYAIYKLDIMMGLKDYRVQQSIHIGYFNGLDRFGQDDGFAIAAGITEWDSGEGATEDPAYGSVKFYIKQWNTILPMAELFRELETRFCTAEDFKEESELFYSAAKSANLDIDRYAHRLKCLVNPERDLHLWGNYNAKIT